MERTMDTRKGFKLTLCVTSLLLAAVVGASAWTWANYVTVFTGGGLCVQGDAGIDHIRPGTLSGNLAYSDAYARDQQCFNGLVGRWATTRLDVYHAAAGQPGAICRGTDWKSDYTGIDSFGNPIGPSWVFNYGGPASCGSGWYGVFGGAFVWDGSTWRGGWVWSGWEWVPPATLAMVTSTSAQNQTYNEQTPPPRPDWVDADGKVNMEKAPKEVPMAGPNGNRIMEAGKEKQVPTHFGTLPPPPLRTDMSRRGQ